MSDMTGHDVRKGPHRHGLAACRSDPQPPIVVQPSQNNEVRLTHLIEFLDEIREAAPVEARTRHVIVLLEARERVFIATAEAERAKPEHPFGIYDVADHLPHAPFAFGVAELLLASE